MKGSPNAHFVRVQLESIEKVMSGTAPTGGKAAKDKEFEALWDCVEGLRLVVERVAKDIYGS